ncbi:GNAT family N-acetyltransferase [Thioalkalivibrio sp. XN8]|uniref:GNAT family N-acetyltransferase n=1 Tax=Thioalkalivibrio sp. XN8 TaxID=2712863 RepID=UPI0013EA9A28|nr:GNAT family N-acetyltransferase [Thioalkalivibrio sp. XN8]
MRYRVIHGRELDAGLADRWGSLQRSDPQFASPYFRPEYAQAVAATRNDLRICLLEDGNQVVGFFPFHRSRGGVARPAGLGLSDHHGVIVEPAAEWHAADLLRGAGIVRWEFDHLLASQQAWETWHAGVERSPVIGAREGFEQYEATRSKSQRKHLQDTYRRARKLEREQGEFRFVVNTRDESVLDTLVGWKREQCRRSGVVDYFGLGWTVELIQRIHEHDSPDFGGTLSALHLGDELIAAHFAMRSRDVWHSWFPGYEDHYRNYAPGLVLLVEMIRHACNEKFLYIDLGKGMAPYKEAFSTDAVMVAEGCAVRPSLVNRAYELRARAERWGRQSSLRPLLRAPGRWIKRLERKWRYD